MREETLQLTKKNKTQGGCEQLYKCEWPIFDDSVKQMLMELSIHSLINSAESPQTLAALLPLLAPQHPQLWLGASVEFCPPSPSCTWILCGSDLGVNGGKPEASRPAGEEGESGRLLMGDE